jgi:hypothetical protein
MGLILKLHVVKKKNNGLNSSTSCIYVGHVLQYIVIFIGLGTLGCISFPLPVMEYKRQCFLEPAALPGSGISFAQEDKNCIVLQHQ